MSFEGFYQCLCEKGHYTTLDVYETTKPFEETCDDCGSQMVWYTLVDQTNCCHLLVTEEDPATCPMSNNGRCHGVGIGYIELKEKEPAVWITCETCGVSSCVREETYKIPPKGVGCHKEPEV